MSTTRFRTTLFAASLGLLAAAACGPSTRDDNASDNGNDNDTDDSTCVPNGDFETCGGGVDDDCDGDIDCDDLDCAEADLCQGNGTGCEFETPTASLEMPDGEGCTGGDDPIGSNASTGCETYDSPLEFQGFPSGATLTNASDLISVCMIAEHSWIPDLQIELHCPDGTMVELIEFLGRENSGYLGIPDPADNGPGTGWEYCFVPTAANAPILDYIAANHPATVPAGDYQPAGDFANFVGCPLNGEWMLQAQDRWGIDNGYVTSWQINFSETLADDCQID